MPRNTDKCGRVGGNQRGRGRRRIIADVAATPPTPTFKKEIKAKSGEREKPAAVSNARQGGNKKEERDKERKNERCYGMKEGRESKRS